jgi:cytochrome b6-f complex iron-sulfur subunit
VILAACSPKVATPPTDEEAAESNNSPISKAENAATQMGGYTEVGTIAALDASGGISTELGGKKVYVFRSPANQSLIALDPTCNHKGCPVKLAGDDLECSCHGSRFALDGSLTKGPATAGLPLYSVKEEDGKVLVSVA